MRHQIHHQPKEYSKSKETILIDQADIHNHEEMRDWIKRIQSENPLPEGYQWMVCNEESEFFACTYNSDSIA